MNETGRPAVDWAAVFERAHRRLVGRFVVIGAVGATGAALLLAGGLAARAAIGGEKPAAHRHLEGEGHRGENGKPKRHRRNGGTGPTGPRTLGGSGLPNLVIASLTTSGVVVENSSNATAGPFEVVVAMPFAHIPPLRFRSGGLPPGGSKSLPFKCAGKEGVVEVDPDNRVEESNETDNKATIPCAGRSTTGATGTSTGPTGSVTGTTGSVAGATTPPSGLAKPPATATKPSTTGPVE